MPKKVVILHSGGMDSTLCLLMAKEKGYEILSLGIDYKQNHRIELDFALNQCIKYNITRKVLRVEWDKPERTIPENRVIGEMVASISPAFLPGRNVLFLSLACSEASGLGYNEVWMGVNSIDYSGYPDCRPEFITAFQKMLNIGMPDGPQIVTPIISMSKPQIASEAARLGISENDTWSCYQPVFSNGIKPCGRCDACILHSFAWSNIK